MSESRLKRPRVEGTSVTTEEILAMDTTSLISWLTETKVMNPASANIIRSQGLDAPAMLYLGRNVETYVNMGFQLGQAARLCVLIRKWQQQENEINPVGMDEPDYETPDNIRPMEVVVGRKTRFHVLLKQIKEQTPDAAELSNPKEGFSLPFPFCGSRRPTDRFSWDQGGRFLYYGREVFEDVLSKVMELGEYGYQELYISGSLGWGKSYLLGALVCYLMKIGKRVVYAPDARWLNGECFRYLQDCLHLTFADDSHILQVLRQCQDLQDLQIFANDVAESGITLYIFLDQANALDDDSAGRAPVSVRAEVSLFLARFSYKHILIQSASGNFKMADLARLAQENVAKMYMNGGLTEILILRQKEMAVWWERIKMERHTWSAGFKESLEELTGKNPVLLHAAAAVIKGEALGIEPDIVPGQYESEILADICRCNAWEDATARIHKYAWDYIVSRGEMEQKRFFKVMEACVLEEAVSRADRAVLDNRYFSTKAGLGQCESGLARRAITTFLRRHAGGDLFAGMYLDGVTEQFKLVDTFDGIPKNSGDSPALYIPEAWNHPSIDAIIFSVSKIEDRQILIVRPIQITINQRHRDSEATFLADWKRFSMKILGIEEPTKFPYKEERVPEKRRLTRGQTYVAPAYARQVRSIASVSENVGIKLAQARKNGDVYVAPA
ncbi:hypothetical protein L211DRAFT_849639 [Terfezia boudieri ATCC MYA-4762]|uniref:Uncharacterized protein n=1 Tax=Terfezia boudieri ATCC MYA-4762 TaxID=1051890 RepID=A0A3N4LQW9_9PEZI|nr:hypothetical protein L211DRAFT_849639 [Terfezia boudieri ATCC MYA-4762]